MTEGLRPRFKLWFSTRDAEGAFGDGKWRLLDAIARRGSLRAAATELGMSYRKAWGDLKKAERSLGVSLVQRSRGGISGGETKLTEAGRAWLQAYAEFRSDVEEAISSAFAAHIENLEGRKT